MNLMYLDAALSHRSIPERRLILLQYLHQLTIEARDVDEPRRLKGLTEVMHTLVGALLSAQNADDYLVEDAVLDKGKIYGVESNLERAWQRLGRRHGY